MTLRSGTTVSTTTWTEPLAIFHGDRYTYSVFAEPNMVVVTRMEPDGLHASEDRATVVVAYDTNGANGAELRECLTCGLNAAVRLVLEDQIYGD